MNRVFLAVCVLFLSSTASAFYGRNATEAELTFDSVVEGPKNADPDELIDSQVQHLMGTFQSASFLDSFGYPGVLGESYTAKVTKTESVSGGRIRLSYHYEGKVVFHKDAFGGHTERGVSMWMPLSPDQIYDMGMKGQTNVCTDRHYNTEGDFWYFWDPDQKGCPLAGNDTDVLRLKGHLVRLPNTRTSYPEYSRLYGDNGNGQTLKATIFIGYISEIESLKDPNRRDDGAKTLRAVERELKDREFTLKEKQDAFREYVNGRVVDGIAFRRVYEKEITSSLGDPLHVEVELLLSDTDSASKDLTFHRHLLTALEDSDLLMYDGHSGLGGNLDLTMLPKLKFDPQKYQIFFFNGCSSYPYFNANYFRAKGGSRNLDIITSGLETYAESAAPNVIAFLDHFISGDAMSFQKILGDLEESNGDAGTYLTGVNGDEDNRWKP
jgi:hypothetical protein